MYNSTRDYLTMYLQDTNIDVPLTLLAYLVSILRHCFYQHVQQPKLRINQRCEQYANIEQNPQIPTIQGHQSETNSR